MKTDVVQMLLVVMGSFVKTIEALDTLTIQERHEALRQLALCANDINSWIDHERNKLTKGYNEKGSISHSPH